ncbi:MAG: FkbM family methyltransferase [Thermoanaerobaculia bacterium]
MKQPSRAASALVARMSRRGIRRSVVDEFGNQLVLLLPDRLCMQIYADREYEQDVVAFAKRVLRPGMVAFDVGAHIGMHTVLFRKLVATAGRVVAFEPIGLLFEILSANAAGDSRVQLESLAVADGGTTELVLKYYGLSFSGWTTAFEPHADASLLRKMPTPRLIRVPSTSLDAYAEETGVDPDFIKLDIEGGELTALRGARRLIARAKPFIIMECGDSGRLESHSTSRCLELLERSGYQFLEFDKRLGLVQRHAVRASYPEHSNLLGVPKEPPGG